MSVFRVYLNDTSSYRNEFLGTALAGRKFHSYWVDNQPTEVFEDFIYGMINDHGCIVTYDTGFIVKTAINHGKKILFYEDGGHDRVIQLKGEQDKPNQRKVNMVVPSRSVDETEPYLAEALTIFKDKTIGDSDKQAFLLGMLLLKRCR